MGAGIDCDRCARTAVLFSRIDAIEKGMEQISGIPEKIAAATKESIDTVHKMFEPIRKELRETELELREHRQRLTDGDRAISDVEEHIEKGRDCLDAIKRRADKHESDLKRTDEKASSAIQKAEAAEKVSNKLRPLRPSVALTLTGTGGGGVLLIELIRIILQ